MKYFLIILSLFVAFSISNGQTNVSGTIALNTTWDTTGSPYIVTGNVTLNSGYTLTIDSGVVVRFQSAQGMFIRGTLNARHVLFTSVKDTIGGTPANGDWSYIQIGDASFSGTATVDTCRILYGGTASFPSQNGNVYIHWGTASFTGCDISFSKNYGIMLTASASVSINNCNIFSCDWPITYTGPGALVFNGANNFTGNTHDGVYVKFASNSNAFVLDTINVPYTFLNTYTVNAGGSLQIATTNILKFGSGYDLVINGTLIANAAQGDYIYFTAYTDDNLGGDTNGDGTATAPAARYWGGITFNDVSIDAACLMRRCKVTFAGNGNTGGISLYNASPTIDSCDLANNYYGVLMQDVSNPVFTNNTVGSSMLVPIAMSFAANPVFNNNTLSFSDNEYDAIGLLGGTLPADAVVPIRDVTAIPNITYLMLGSVTVPAGKTLTINKGVVIKGYNYSDRIIVKGKLIANATADSMITMTSAKDDSYGNPFDTNRDGSQSSPAKGDWSGIVFEGTSDTNSIVNYCRIKYGSLSSTYYNTRYISGGEITTVNASPTISNCEFEDVNYGIYAFQASNPKIWNNSFTNTYYTPIALSVSADPSFSGNTFTNTRWTALGIIGEAVGMNGTLRKRTVAGYENITYILLEDLTINSGTYVSIEPGVVIKCNASGIFVDGGFRAVGIPDPITFTSIKDDNIGNPFDTNGDGAASAPAKGDWKAIKFEESSDDSYCLLQFCDLKFPGQSVSPTSGGVIFSNAGGTVSDINITDSYVYGVVCEGGSAPLVNSVSITNSRLDPIAMSLKANPTFTNITFAANGSKGIRILEGTLSSDATLIKRDVAGINNIAYIINSLTISENAVLTIEEGVVIKFLSYQYGIVVNGALIAQGLPSQKIIFTSIKDDANGGDTNDDGNASVPNKSDWHSITFTSSGIDTLNSLKHCEVRYSGSGYCCSYIQYGAIRISNTTAKIDSVDIHQSGTSAFGVYGSANPVIANCLLTNISSTPVTMSMFSNPTFTNISALNIGLMAIGIVPETYSVNDTIPVRNFAGYDNITYFFHDPSTINSGTTITVPEGVVFKCSNSNNIFAVNGALIVNGTPAHPVVFTETRDDASGNPGDTNGDGSATKPSVGSNQKIFFDDVSNDTLSSIRHAVFRYSCYGISLLGASPKINTCTFENLQWGVKLNGVSQPVIDSCLFNDITNGPIFLSLVSYPSSTAANVITGTTFKVIGVIDETLVQDVTLTKHDFAGIANIPYLFGKYAIGTGAILTLSPGLVLKFLPGGYIDVKKGLIAEGGASPDSMIVFTEIRDDFYGGDSNSDSTATATGTSNYSWAGITFENESQDPLCRLKYCVVKFAKYSNGSGITAISASPSITFSSIVNNYVGIEVNAASNPVVNYCDISQNTSYGINNVNKSFNIDARNNWWGNNSGPTHSSNPGGTGDKITDSVRYQPFLTSGAQQPITGDASLNGSIQAYDASVILQYVVDPIGYPLNDIQQRVADVSGEMGITAYDASLILQYVVGNILAFPVEILIAAPISLPKIIVQGINIGDVSAVPGSKITIPIKVSGVSNFASADIQIQFDGKMLKPNEIKLAQDFPTLTMYKKISNDGITIAIASDKLIEIDGDLVYLTFDVAGDVRGSGKSSLTVSQFYLNEKDFSASVKSDEFTIAGKPQSYALDNNYPNPFNPTTTIRYQIPDDAVHVTLGIYNTVGELVRTLVDGIQSAGDYTTAWDGTNKKGNHVASGMYFYRLTASGDKNFTSVKKMLLMK